MAGVSSKDFGAICYIVLLKKRIDRNNIGTWSLSVIPFNFFKELIVIFRDIEFFKFEVGFVSFINDYAQVKLEHG